MFWISYLVVLLIFALFRARLIALAVKNNSHTDGDAINHLEFLRQIYQNKGIIPKKISKYLLDTNDYPNGYYKLLYYLKITPGFADKYGGYLSLVWDVLNISIIFIAVKLWGGENFEWLLFIPFLNLWLAHTGRAFFFSARPFGVFVTNLFLFGLIGFYIEKDLIYLVVAMIGFIGFSTSSQFGWQAALFYTIGLSFYDINFFVIFIVLLALSSIITRGYSITVLLGLIRHSSAYKTYFVKIHPSTIANKYLEILDFIKSPSFEGLKYLYRHSSLVAFFALIPLNLIVIYNFAVNALALTIFDVWFLCGLLLVILISTKTLKFLGEPERYLEYSVVAVFVLISDVNPISSPVVFFLIPIIFLTLCDVIYNARAALKVGQANDKKEKSIIDLIEFMSSVHQSVVLTIPTRLSFMLGYFSIRNEYVSLFMNIGKGVLGSNFKELVPDRYAFPGNRIDYYINKYKINYIVAEVAAIKRARNLFGDDYYKELDKADIAFQNEHYIVFDVSKT